MQNTNKPSKETTVQRWQWILLTGVILVALVLGIGRMVSGGIDAPPVILQVVEPVCEASGGVWNSCGSLCRGDVAALCAQVCIGLCECTSSEQCPFGFECGEFVNETGICQKSS